MADKKNNSLYVEIFCLNKACQLSSCLPGSTPLHKVKCKYCNSLHFSFFGKEDKKTETNFTKKIIASFKKKSKVDLKPELPSAQMDTNFMID